MLNLAALKTAVADKAELQRKLDEATVNLTTAQADLATAQAAATAEKTRADALQAQIDEANTTISELTGKVTTLETEKKTVSQAAVEKLHELGVPAAELPKSKTPGNDDADILARYQSLTGGEKTAFFRANRAALERAAAQQK
jgi:chromosome segregation ATPase